MKNVHKFHLTIMLSSIIIMLIAGIFTERSIYNIAQDLKQRLLFEANVKIDRILSKDQELIKEYVKNENIDYAKFVKIFANGVIVYKKSYVGKENNVKVVKNAIKVSDVDFEKIDNSQKEKYFLTYFNKNFYVIFTYTHKDKRYFLVENLNKTIKIVGPEISTVQLIVTENKQHKDAIEILNFKGKKVYIDYNDHSIMKTIYIIRITYISFIVFFITSIIMTTLSEKERKKLREILKDHSMGKDISKCQCDIKGFPGLIYSTIQNLIVELQNKNRELEQINKLTIRKKEVIENFFVTNSEKYFNLSYPEFFKVILNVILNMLPHGEKGSVVIADKNKEYKFLAMKGYDISLYKNIRLSKSQLFINFDEKNDRPTIIKEPLKNIDTSDESQTRLNTYGNLYNLKETLAAPVKIEGNIVSIIYIDIFSDKQSFTNADVELMQYFVAYIGAFLRNKIYYDEIKKLSNTDGLTGIYNRRYFEKILINEIKRTKRYEYKSCILYFDLDDFKKINDTYGHQVGDKALVKFVSHIKDNLRTSDILSRFGGDEFIALLPFTEEKEALSKIEALRKKELFIEHNNKKINIKYSVGYAIIPTDGQTTNEIIIKADMKMYENKLKRKNIESNT